MNFAGETGTWPDDSHQENHLEGELYTHLYPEIDQTPEIQRMTELIHQSNLIEDIDDPAFDEQSQKAWDFLADQTSISHYEVMKVQEIITSPQPELPLLAKGHYRDTLGYNVWIGGRKGPEPHKVLSLMDDWLHSYENSTPKEAHIQFEHIHPFADGNGRTGRMLMWWHEIQLGQEPTLINFSERQDYYRWFR